MGAGFLPGLLPGLLPSPLPGLLDEPGSSRAIPADRPPDDQDNGQHDGHHEDAEDRVEQGAHRLGPHPGTRRCGGPGQRPLDEPTPPGYCGPLGSPVGELLSQPPGTLGFMAHASSHPSRRPDARTPGMPGGTRWPDLGSRPEDLIRLLRGGPGRRPVVDRSWALGLRERLEDVLASGADPGADGCTGPRVLAGGRAPLDALVGALWRSWVVAGPPTDPWEEGLAGLVTSGQGRAAEALRRLRGAAATRARTAATASVATLAGFRTVDPRWHPHPGERLVGVLGGGRVLVVSEIDLGLGRPAGTRASRCLVTVGAFGPTAQAARSLRRAALLEALRSGAAPFQVVGIALVSREAWAWPVDPPLLERAVAELVRELGALGVPGRRPARPSGAAVREAA